MNYFNGLRCFWMALAFSLAAMPALGQTNPPAPPAPTPMSSQQMDTMVEAISQSVMKKLHDQGMQPQPATAPAAEAGPPMANSNDARFFMHLGGLVSATPALWKEIGRISEHLDAPYNNGRSLQSYLVALAAGAFLVLAAEWLIRLLISPLRRRLAARIHSLAGLRSLLLLALLEAPPLLAFWVASNAIEASRFMGDTPQIRFSILVLWCLLLWRLIMTAFRITLRPGLAGARLPDLGDGDAAAIFFRTSLGIVLILTSRALGRVLQAIDAPLEVIGCAQIYGAIAMSVLITALCISLNGPIGRWFAGIAHPGRANHVKVVLAKHWLYGAVPLFILFACADIYGAVAGQVTVPNAIALTLAILVGLLLIESLVYRVRVLLEHPTADGAPAIHPRGAEALTRCIRLAVLLIAATTLVRIWTVDIGGMMANDDYSRLARSLTAAGITVFGAFCAWELVSYFTDRYSQTHHSLALPPGIGDTEEEVPLSAASRVATMMPLLRIALVATISVLAVLTVLSQLGVNVTPLIAGASIFGLAISFGSQTLVKDVVSGVFYLVDDAFRVGEYIDCGKAKGTVEGFTLRSLRLRHQNGPVHTIPYGQLGQITNYSRDWATIKFTLRFAHETDLEKLRKAVKKVGQEMLEDPEMKDEFLTPLKMQGIFDIVDSAMVVRFKFTVKPNKPTFVQREALKRLVRILPEQGIQFATGTVSVKTLGGQLVPEAVAAAASASTATIPAPTPLS